MPPPRQTSAVSVLAISSVFSSCSTRLSTVGSLNVCSLASALSSAGSVTVTSGKYPPVLVEVPSLHHMQRSRLVSSSSSVKSPYKYGLEVTGWRRVFKSTIIDLNCRPPGTQYDTLRGLDVSTPDVFSRNHLRSLRFQSNHFINTVVAASKRLVHTTPLNTL